MSIAADVTLRLQALARGDQAREVTHEELIAALRERIGSRSNAVREPATRVRKSRTPRPKLENDPDAIDLFAED